MRKFRVQDFEVSIPDSDIGTIVDIRIDIPVEWDEELREWLLTPTAHRLIELTRLTSLLNYHIITVEEFIKREAQLLKDN